MSFEGQQIFYTDQQLIGDQQFARNGNDGDGMDRGEAELKFMHFILEV